VKTGPNDRQKRVGSESTVERHSVAEPTDLHEAMAKVEKHFGKIDGKLKAVDRNRFAQVSKSFVINKGRGSSVVEQPIRNRQVVGSTPTLGSRISHQ
jgi:hypothetical protein